MHGLCKTLNPKLRGEEVRLGLHVLYSVSSLKGSVYRGSKGNYDGDYYGGY